MNRKNYILILILMFLSVFTQAQTEEASYRYEGGKVYMHVPMSLDSLRIDSILENIESSLAICDSLDQVDSKFTISGWEMTAYESGYIEYSKTIKNLKGDAKENLIILDEKMVNAKNYNLNVKYGVNDMKRKSVRKVSDGEIRFRLYDHDKARKVILSGTFNNWSTSELEMQKVDDVWEIKLLLPPGKHLYKFIVDGKWINDPYNKKIENDGNGNMNSVFFNYNYTFKLKGYPDAKKVYLAASFNDWRRKEIKMEKYKGEWKVAMYLEEGLHTYKFIVDGEWILDPENPSTRNDGAGNTNSALALGKKYLFSTDAFSEAEKVYLSGDFNAWNGAEIAMTREEGKWETPVALKPGNYQYKYVVDGEWTIDPDNNCTVGSGDYVNSVRSIEANHRFILEGYEDAKEVYISGSFNGWPHDGYKMEKVDGKWRMTGEETDCPVSCGGDDATFKKL